MPNRGQKMGNINDGTIWEREFKRQLHGVQVALHSLKMQAEQRRAKPHSKVSKQFDFTFTAVEEAWRILNTPEPEAPIDPNADLIPSPRGRREFLADLKGDDR